MIRRAAAGVLLTASLAFAQGQGDSSREIAVRIDRALKENPAVYPRELVEKCTAAAIAELRACRPDPSVVARLAALPENSWLEMNEPESNGTPQNHHGFPRGRGEGSAVYDAATGGMVCFGGCGAPDYSSDLWVYKTGANRWFEVWPNVPKKEWKQLSKPPENRPLPGCTIGFAYAHETGCVYRFICANAGDDSPNVWETRVLSGEWKIVGRDPGMSAGGVRIVADPVLRGLLSPRNGMKLFSFESKQWAPVGSGGPNAGSCVALTYLLKHKCALLVCGPPEQEKTALDGKARRVETWLFHSETRQWEQVRSERNPEWYYRGGITYDSVNNVAILGGWKTNSPADGPDVSPGLWVFEPQAKQWRFMAPASGPKGRFEYLAYDPEYNVVVTAGNGHGTWVYRYKGGLPERKAPK